MRNQIEKVESIEHKLSVERSRLQGMMQHLRMKPSPDTTTPNLVKMEAQSPLRSPKIEGAAFSIQPAQQFQQQTTSQPQVSPVSFFSLKKFPLHVVYISITKSISNTAIILL